MKQESKSVGDFDAFEDGEESKSLQLEDEDSYFELKENNNEGFTDRNLTYLMNPQIID